MAASVARDKVKVNLEIDGYIAGEYYFPYSTTSASPDGSGWYCMPEIGDQVRIYFPSKEEREAFAISAIGGYMPKEDDTKDYMSDPNTKYIRTNHNKLVQFTENGILIDADEGQASIQHCKDGTVSILASQGISVFSENNIVISAGKSLLISATEEVDIKCEAGGEIKMDEKGNTEITGQEVLIN